MCHIRIFVRLGGKVGELDLKKRDLADLCEIQPGAAGEWVSGGIERISLVDLARIMQELELYSLDDVFEVRIIGTPPPPEGRRERILSSGSIPTEQLLGSAARSPAFIRSSLAPGRTG